MKTVLVLAAVALFALAIESGRRWRWLFTRSSSSRVRAPTVEPLTHRFASSGCYGAKVGPWTELPVVVQSAPLCALTPWTAANYQDRRRCGCKVAMHGPIVSRIPSRGAPLRL